MNATLIRHPSASTVAMLGVLVLDTSQTFQTLELPWYDNQDEISCIPEGTYQVVPWKSPSKGDCFKVLDVPEREHILIHVGNSVEDTQGCILIGQERHDDIIGFSRAALKDLKDAAPAGFTMRVEAV